MRRSIQGPAQQFDLQKGAEIDIRLHIKLQHVAFHHIFCNSLSLLDKFFFASHFLFSYCKVSKLRG